MEGEMIATLPMYDSYIPRESSEALWQAVVAGCRGEDFPPPAALDHNMSCRAAWSAGKSLFLSQTCGYPLVQYYEKDLILVGTPVYAARGCDGPNYRSALIVHASCEADSLSSLLTFHTASKVPLLLGANCVDSFSGFLMLLSALAEVYDPDGESVLEIPSVLITGSHSSSVNAVRNGHCHLAAIDCVTLALGERSDSLFMEDIRIIGWTRPAPSLPFVTQWSISQPNLEIIRQGLTAMLSTNAASVVKAREDSLLIDIDLSDNITLSSYKKAVYDHVQLASRIDSIISLTPQREKLIYYNAMTST